MNSDLYMFLFYITPIAVSLIWPIKLLFSPKRATGAQWLHASMMVLSAFALLFFAAHKYHIVTHPYLADVLYTLVSVLIYPTFYMCICELTRRGGSTVRDRRIAYLPVVVYSIVFVVVVFSVGADTFSEFNTRFLAGEDRAYRGSLMYNLLVIVGFWCFNLLVLLQVIGFLSFAGIRLRRFRKDLVDYNPALKRKARKAFWVFGLTFMQSVLVSMLLLNPHPDTMAKVGLNYVVILLFSSVSYLNGQAAGEVDITMKQILEAKRLKEESQTANTQSV